MIAPADWHIPTDAEWTTLTAYLGGAFEAGGKLKESGTSHWLSPNANATNSSGFTALPGGQRDPSFRGIGTFGCRWSAMWVSIGDTFNRSMEYNYYSVTPFAIFYKNFGFSVRCVRD